MRRLQLRTAAVLLTLGLATHAEAQGCQAYNDETPPRDCWGSTDVRCEQPSDYVQKCMVGTTFDPIKVTFDDGINFVPKPWGCRVSSRISYPVKECDATASACATCGTVEATPGKADMWVPSVIPKTAPWVAVLNQIADDCAGGPLKTLAEAIALGAKVALSKNPNLDGDLVVDVIKFATGQTAVGDPLEQAEAGLGAVETAMDFIRNPGDTTKQIALNALAAGGCAAAGAFTGGAVTLIAGALTFAAAIGALCPVDPPKYELTTDEAQQAIHGCWNRCNDTGCWNRKPTFKKTTVVPDSTFRFGRHEYERVVVTEAGCVGKYAGLGTLHWMQYKSSTMKSADYGDGWAVRNTVLSNTLDYKMGYMLGAKTCGGNCAPFIQIPSIRQITPLMKLRWCPSYARANNGEHLANVTMPNGKWKLAQHPGLDNKGCMRQGIDVYQNFKMISIKKKVIQRNSGPNPL